MNSLNELLQDLGISKVRLAKYLNVSRQMVYNYLELEDLNKWPKEKKILLMKLLDIEDGSDSAISRIKITTDYLMAVENRLNQGVKYTGDAENAFDFKGLEQGEQTLLTNIIYLLKEKLTSEKDHNKNIAAVKYLYHMLQSIDNVPEIKYILGYMAKTTGFIEPNEFAFDEEHQYIFEGILYSALSLYNNGGASKSKIVESRKRFVQEIEQQKEDNLGRTQQLTTIKVQALKELGYSELNEANAAEVLEKIVEIESRKV